MINLVDGTLGGNLLSKYSMLGRFFVTQDALTFLHRVIKQALLKNSGVVSDDALDDVIEYLRKILLHSPFVESVSDEVEWDTIYDVEAWTREKYSKPLDEYLSTQRTLRASVEPERQALIKTRVETFGDHPAGLGKFTRTMFARELRRTVQLCGQEGQ